MYFSITQQSWQSVKHDMTACISSFNNYVNKGLFN